MRSRDLSESLSQDWGFEGLLFLDCDSYVDITKSCMYDVCICVVFHQEWDRYWWMRNISLGTYMNKFHISFGRFCVESFRRWRWNIVKNLDVIIWGIGLLPTRSKYWALFFAYEDEDGKIGFVARVTVTIQQALG